MTVTLTSKGRITIPLSIRKRPNLNAGDQLEFDETAPILTAWRVVHRGQWEETLRAWQTSAQSSLHGHPWEHQPAASVLNDLRATPW